MSISPVIKRLIFGSAAKWENLARGSYVNSGKGPGMVTGRWGTPGAWGEENKSFRIKVFQDSHG